MSEVQKEEKNRRIKAKQKPNSNFASGTTIFEPPGIIVNPNSSHDKAFNLSEALKSVITFPANPYDSKNNVLDMSRLSLARLEHFAASTPGAIVCCQPSDSWKLTFVSEKITNIIGYEAGLLMNQPELWLEKVHADDKEELIECLKRLPDLGSDVHEFRILHQNGSYRWIRSEIKVYEDTNQKPGEFISWWMDITSYKQLEQQLIYDAFHDRLTGLPNRLLFIDRLNVSLARRIRKPDQLFAVFLVDLDRFKNVNDRLGHEAGNQLLIEVARRLTSCLRFGDTISRLGGDEFVMIIEDLKGQEKASSLGERILKIFETPFVVAGKKIKITASLGIVLPRSGYESAEQMLRDADIAMYLAKKEGRARFVFADETLREQTLSQINIEDALHEAYEKNEFLFYYQPIIDLSKGEIFGFEALLRWQHKTLGLMLPHKFIRLAEETNLIVPVSQRMTCTAFHQICHWRQQFPQCQQAKISLNISPTQFQNEFPQQLKSFLAESNLSPSSVILEITESVLIDDIKRAAKILNELNEIGVHIYMDDFGSGYSSMNYLHNLPVNGLKIDRSFVSSLKPRSGTFEIIKAIIELAQKLKLRVVAEGVETAEQLRCLKELGCRFVQGFYFSPPLKVAAAEEFIKHFFPGLDF